MQDILVIGESCRDVFVYCDTTRLCPEAPVPVLVEKYRKENGGMAKNTQQNIMCLLPHCDIITNSCWETITKIRYVHADSNHMFFRADSSPAISKINLKDVTYDYKMIVISDYDKGFLSTEDIEEICSTHSCVFIDTKKRSLSIFEAHSNCIIKINEFEYEQLENSDCLTCELVVTRGSKGAQWVTENRNYEVVQTEVFDVCGAGDTFLAALVVGYLSFDQNLDKAIRFANECASYSVRKLGTYAIKKEDLNDLRI